MEDEIKVGEYCRTRKGIIGILKQQFTFGHGVNYPEPQEWVIDVKGKKYVTIECDVDFDNIVKHSPNIIDLIEKGDYVNGKEIDSMTFDLFINSDFREEYGKAIETIATKEMMESISYKVERK